MTGTILVGTYVFVLAMFVGFEVITKVPPTLHTPLMSGSNAISGIAIVGAVVVAGAGQGPLFTAIGVAAVALATVNVVGGFLVTDRMLAMFRRERSERAKPDRKAPDLKAPERADAAPPDAVGADAALPDAVGADAVGTGDRAG